MITSLILATAFLASAQDETTAPEFAIVSPARGEFVSDLRPVIETTAIGEDQVVYIEISPEPEFESNNTLIYVGAPDADLANYAIARANGWPYPQKLDAMNAFERSNRYRDGAVNRWQVNYNLTAVLIPPYGYRIVGCREFLRAFTERVTEGHDDPAQAIFEFVSAYVVNEGTRLGYYDAYEILGRSYGVCGHTAELMSAMSVAAGMEARILGISGTTGHIISEVRTEDDGWQAFDPLYHVAFEQSADEIVAEVASDETALDYTLYPNAPYIYRDMFQRYNASSSLQTTMTGTHMSTTPDGTGTRYEDLTYICSPQQMILAQAVEQTVHRNVWFVRAAVGDEQGLGEFVYSYFVHDPDLDRDEERIDNWRIIWRDGANIPARFLE